MSDCCSTHCRTESFPRKRKCPVNGKEYGAVSPKTIKHHIKEPWLWKVKHQGYYFCSDPDCSVVYFGQDDSVIEKESVRTEIGVKEQSENALVCYCFGITKAQAKISTLARQFVIEETRQKQCACETRNPSGKCCLSDFSKQ